MTLEKEFENYLRAQGLAGESVKHYCGLVKTFLSKDPETFWAQDIGRSTRRGYFYALKYWDKFANTKYSKNIVPPSTPESDPHPLSVEDFQKLKEAKVVTEWDHRQKALFSLLSGCGLRISEALLIRPEDISATEINVLGKGDKKRKVALPVAVADILNQYLAVKTSSKEFLITNAGGPMSRYAAYGTLTRWARLHGVKLTPHSLRHTFGCFMLANGADIMSIRDQMGHSSLNATQVYLKVSIEDRKKVVEKYNPFS